MKFTCIFKLNTHLSLYSIHFFGMTLMYRHEYSLYEVPLQGQVFLQNIEASHIFPKIDNMKKI